MVVTNMSQKKLADVLGELRPLADQDVFPDIDQDLPPLDSDPLG